MDASVVEGHTYHARKEEREGHSQIWPECTNAHHPECRAAIQKRHKVSAADVPPHPDIPKPVAAAATMAAAAAGPTQSIGRKSEF